MDKVWLSDICNPKQWKTIPTNDLLDEGYPVYGANGVIGYYSQYNHENPVVVVTCRGATCGSVNITTPKAYITGNAMCLDDIRSDIDNEYLYYCLKQYDFNKIISGSAQPQITRQGMNKIYINICPHNEQIKIIKKLKKIDRIIKYRKQELSMLNNLIKARFVEMFGDTRKNPYNYMKLTVAEAIEAGYIEKPFDGNHGGKHPKSSEYVECGIPFLMANNIVDGKVDLVNCSFITEERANKLDKGFARDNDVLITHKGTIGRTAVLRTDYDFVMLTPQVASYRVKDGLTSDYLCGYFNTDYFQNDMKTLASAGGSTRAYAGITAQLQLKLIIPPIDLQNQFAAFVQRIDKSKLLSLIKLLEQLITYLYNVFIIYRQDKGEEVENHE